MLGLDCAPKSDRITGVVKAESEKRSGGKPRLRFSVRVDRVRDRLADLGLNAAEAARRGGLERTYVADLLENKKKTLRGVYLERLAEVLQCSPAFLRGMSDEATGPAVRGPRPEVDGFPLRKNDETLPLLGSIEFGAFRTGTPSISRVNITPDRRYPSARQAAFKVAGDELLAIGMPAGTHLACVNAEDMVEQGPGIRSGQLVVVSIETPLVAGRETSIRRVEVSDDGIELVSPAPGIEVAAVEIPDGLSIRRDGWTVSVLFVVTRSTQLLD